MQNIYKYRISDAGSITLPSGAKLLKLDYQSGKLTVWAQVDIENPITRIMFERVGTGDVVPPLWQYITTLFEGPFVWHWFLVPS